MRKKQRYSVLLAVIFLILFLVFTVLVKTVDVQPIGPDGSSVGLASINKPVADKLPLNMTWYTITIVCGIIAILFGCCFAVYGILQLIHRKSLLRVDKTLLALGVFFVLLGVVYLFFEKVPINYRPVLMDGVLEASYPSSHTVLVCCVMGASVVELKCIMHRGPVLASLTVFCILLTFITVLGRILSGAHWFTDIVGGLLLSSALIYLFRAAVYTIRISERRKSRKK